MIASGLKSLADFHLVLPVTCRAWVSAMNTDMAWPSA